MKRRSFLLGSAALLGMPQISSAQSKYPSHAITYIVPVAPGGGSDFVGRAVTNAWGKELGQTFIVDNQGGGGGIIACQKTARSQPDGYVLMQGYVATLATSPATRHVPYDPIRDFTPVGMIGGTPNVLVVNSKLPIHNLQDFIAYSKKNDGNTNYGSAGAGSLTHLLMELLKQRVGSNMVHIAYKGVSPAFTDLIAGQTQAMFPGLAAAVPHLKSQTVRAIAVTGKTRNPRFKDVPTFEELGIKGFDDVLQWYGVSGPAGMDKDVVKVLNDSLNKVLVLPDLAKQLEIEAIEPMPMTSAEFADYAKLDLERWTKLAKEQNINLTA
ncbi:Bug family tripartite tricarboxylate transporter substrate binding protein [Pollutimonas bauzanensis]|uniref:Tripartite-type tricarboxylate transporter, receptor component TctC n=1 Tax=Pollutimonas bauzanensis TaxID=658167 RepID=A0A1M5M2Y0_9BURK|nr:tripartite tricarboxylate transporter substrate binding protein [Pollutimonas bauzanensis]SHG71279.1 Tripartite-type tricarboxylate transporter, receptor component TctC [Pollutimonas bauzanensis]